MGLPPPDIGYGRYRVTEATVVRPAFDGFAPRFQVSQEVVDDLRAVERADHDLQRFQVDPVLARRLLEEALTRNTFATASIEGNPLTLDQVESLLVHGPTPDNEVRPDEREILNMARFLDRLDDTPVPRTPAEVAALHGRLFDGVLPDAGRFKTRPNFIGKRPEHVVTFVPTAPERVQQELSDALAWAHDAPHPPLVKAFILFHETQGIHPFRDGNGRIGRALLTLFLHHAGYRGVRYALVDYTFNEDRDAYYGTLLEVEQADWDFTPWIRYMARILRRTFEDAVARFLFHDALPATLNDRQVRLAAWCATLDRRHPGKKVKFNDVHAAFPHIAGRTLTRDLAVLRDAGLLVMEGTRKAATYHFNGARRPAAAPPDAPAPR